MSNPSFSNIDRWLFELVEGNLSPEQIAQLEAFILQHPELDVDKDMWELATVEKAEVIYPHQDKFIRRKPIGLYMMAGMTSIAIFVTIGLVEFLSTETELNTYTSELAVKNEVNKPSVDSEQNGSRDLPNSHPNSSSGKQVGIRNSSPVPSWLTSEIVDNNQGASFNALNDLGNVDLTGRFGHGYSNPEIEEVENQDFTGLNTEESTSLSTKPAELFETASGRHWSTQERTKSNRISSVVPDDNFSSKMNRAIRTIGRMMDYPVALKNLKDPMFNMPGMLPIDVNNGLIGTLPGTRIQTLSRAQWLGQSNEQFINQIAVDGYVYGMRGGVGLQVNHSYYGNGQLSNSNVALTYSPKISVNRNVLIEPSVRFKMGSKSINASKIDGSGQVEVDRNTVLPFYTNSTQPLGQDLWYKDLGLGMMVNTKWFFAGVQTDNVFRHYDNIYSGDYTDSRKAATHFIATIGTDYESKRETIGLSPYLIYHQREALQEVWAGVNARVNWFTFGASVSNKLDATAALGVKLDRFAVTCGADYLSSSMIGSKQLSYQLQLRFINLSGNPRQELLNL